MEELSYKEYKKELKELKRKIGVKKIREQTYFSVMSEKDLLHEIWLLKKEMELKKYPKNIINKQLQKLTNKFMKKGEKKEFVIAEKERLFTEINFKKEEDKMIARIDNEKEIPFEEKKEKIINAKIDAFLQSAQEVLIEENFKNNKVRIKYFTITLAATKYYTSTKNKKNVTDFTRFLVKNYGINVKRGTVYDVLNRVDKLIKERTSIQKKFESEITLVDNVNFENKIKLFKKRCSKLDCSQCSHQLQLPSVAQQQKSLLYNR